VDRGSRQGGRVVAARKVGGGEGWQHQDGGREDCGGGSGVLIDGQVTRRCFETDGGQQSRSSRVRAR